MTANRTAMKKIRSYGLQKSFWFFCWHARLLTRRWFFSSYSQLGEDLVIDSLLGHKEKGFYVDVGAGHPIICNNTMRFYKRGWMGINIEPDPVAFAKLMQVRPRDINLSVGVGAQRGTAEYKHFYAGNVSTFSELEAAISMEEGYELESAWPVDVVRLEDVLEEHAEDREIDFMSVDTEGWDLQVLAGNDWSRWSPSVICVETALKHALDASKKYDPAVQRLLESLGYHQVFNNAINTIYLFGPSEGKHVD